LVDINLLNFGSPFRGNRSITPHAGAHVQWDNRTSTGTYRWPPTSEVADYPKIYAIADGYIDMIEYYFGTAPNCRYGISLRFVQDSDTPINFFYSIEPMIDPNNPNFYVPFIHVATGEFVHKGDVIAHMYISPEAGEGTHIHFHLSKPTTAEFLAPALFSREAVTDFFNHWGGYGRDGGVSIETPCLGYKLGTQENPFGTGAVDYLPSPP
jgi:hypothetical protein